MLIWSDVIEGVNDLLFSSELLILKCF